jgi:hypothetical protein
MMQIGNTVSNATSIAVAPNGRACTPVNSTVVGGGTGTHTFGGLTLERLVETTAGVSGSLTTTKMDLAGGSFERITYSNTAPTGSQLDVSSYGSCAVSTYTSGQTPPSSNTGSVTYLDAGPAIGMAAPAPLGNKSIPKTSPGGGLILYSSSLDQTATSLVAGPYTFTGPGGADIGPFSANYTMPPLFAWTNQSSITTVNRANGVTVNWTGGNPTGYVSITGSSTYYGGTVATTIVASFSCTARVSDQTFTVPPVVLLALPPSGSALPGGVAVPGELTVSTYDVQTFPPPSGIESAAVSSSFFYGSSVTYQ